MNQKGLVRRSFSEVGFTPILIFILLAVALVGGYLVYQNQTKITPFTPQQTPKPSTSPSNITRESTTSGETTNWKTYTNTKFGYSFKYPSDAKVFHPDYTTISDKPSDIIIEFGSCLKSNNECSDAVDIAVLKQPQQDLSSYVQSEAKALDPSRCIVQMSKVANESTYQLTGCLVGNSSFYYLQGTNGILKIWVDSTSITANQILSTFRLLP